jgi:putative transposase
MFPDMAAFVAAAAPLAAALERSSGGGRRRGRVRKVDARDILARIWLVCRSGMQWRHLALLGGPRWDLVHYHFQRWTRLGLWRRFAHAALAAWCAAAGHGGERSVAVADSRSVRSTSTAGMRGIDGGKKVKGVKLHALVDRFGIPLEIGITPANVGDRDGLRGLMDMLGDEHPTVGTILGDLGYSGKELRGDAAQLGFDLKTTRCGVDGKFVPAEIRWVVERTFAWLTRWRRLAVMHERNPENHIGFCWVAIAGILSSRLAKLSA